MSRRRITWRDYEADLERKLADLHDQVHSGAYRATPSRRVYIPKPDGGQRPLRAVADVLNAIYEEDFLGFSYGFWPGRGAHDALDALSAAIYARKVNYIVDADIAKFFNSVSKEWLARFLEHRIGDKRVLRLIQKWLRAGVLEDGQIEVPERGTGRDGHHALNAKDNFRTGLGLAPVNPRSDRGLRVGWPEVESSVGSRFCRLRRRFL